MRCDCSYGYYECNECKYERLARAEKDHKRYKEELEDWKVAFMWAIAKKLDLDLPEPPRKP
jgi:hypothetical protein